MKHILKSLLAVSLLSIAAAGPAFAATTEAAFCGGATLPGGVAGCAGPKLNIPMSISYGLGVNASAMSIAWNGSVDDLVQRSEEKHDIMCTIGGLLYTHLNCDDLTTGEHNIVWGNGGGLAKGVFHAPSRFAKP